MTTYKNYKIKKSSVYKAGHKYLGQNKYSIERPTGSHAGFASTIEQAKRRIDYDINYNK